MDGSTGQPKQSRLLVKSWGTRGQPAAGFEGQIALSHIEIFTLFMNPSRHHFRVYSLFRSPPPYASTLRLPNDGALTYPFHDPKHTHAYYHHGISHLIYMRGFVYYYECELAATHDWFNTFQRSATSSNVSASDFVIHVRLGCGLALDWPVGLYLETYRYFLPRIHMPFLSSCTYTIFIFTPSSDHGLMKSNIIHPLHLHTSHSTSRFLFLSLWIDRSV